MITKMFYACMFGPAVCIAAMLVCLLVRYA
jgi:hypothetical protein